MAASEVDHGLLKSVANILAAALLYRKATVENNMKTELLKDVFPKVAVSIGWSQATSRWPAFLVATWSSCLGCSTSWTGWRRTARRRSCTMAMATATRATAAATPRAATTRPTVSFWAVNRRCGAHGPMALGLRRLLCLTCTPLTCRRVCASVVLGRCG